MRRRPSGGRVSAPGFANKDVGLLRAYCATHRTLDGFTRARQRWLVAAVFLLAILTIVAWSLETLPAFATRELTFPSAFAYFAIMFGTFNVFDWLVIDCGLIYWQPRFAVLPGTEGMAGYHDYRFHFRGFLIGIPVTLFASAFAAALLSLFRAGS